MVHGTEMRKTPYKFREFLYIDFDLDLKKSDNKIAPGGTPGRFLCIGRSSVLLQLRFPPDRRPLVADGGVCELTDLSCFRHNLNLFWD